MRTDDSYRQRVALPEKTKTYSERMMTMKKIIALLLLALLTLGLFSCAGNTNGGTVTFSADMISATPVKEEKTFTDKGHTFVYYNVYNDGNGNFVMADNTSYIACNDIQFGLKVKSAYVYQTAGDEKQRIRSVTEENGYFSYSISDFGFEIRGAAPETSTPCENVNIGKIIHWN